MVLRSPASGELVDLALCPITLVAEALLKLANELIFLPGNLIQVVAGQLSATHQTAGCCGRWIEPTPRKLGRCQPSASRTTKKSSSLNSRHALFVPHWPWTICGPGKATVSRTPPIPDPTRPGTEPRLHCSTQTQFEIRSVAGWDSGLKNSRIFRKITIEDRRLTPYNWY
jgi:hypothetical protein